MNKNNTIVDRAQRTITMSRVFDAPRGLAWKICTDPAFIPEWWGPRRAVTIVDKMDVTPGGEWRYIHQDSEGNEVAFSGVYQEVVAPERLTYTFEFEPLPGHVATETIYFEEAPGGKTKLTAVTVYPTLEDLDGTIESGMEGGAIETWDRLQELLTRTTMENQS